MRKRYVAFAVLGLALAVLSSAGPAHALGLSLQYQNSKDLEDAWGLGIHKQFSIIPIVSVEGRVSWLDYGEKNYGNSLQATSLSMFPIEAVGKASLGLFYGGLGLGYYIFSGDVKPDNSFGAFLAAGAEFGFVGFGIFGEIRYLFLDPSVEGGGSADASGVGAHIGARLPLI